MTRQEKYTNYGIPTITGYWKTPQNTVSQKKENVQ